MNSKKKSHLIHIDFEQRQELEKYKIRIRNPEFTDEPKKFALVEKNWYSAFNDWFTTPNIPPPGEIRTKNLILNKKFNPNLIMHEDYEPIEEEIFQKLYKIFGVQTKIIRYIRKHPETGKPTLLNKPFQMRIHYFDDNHEDCKILEIVDPSWPLKILTKYLSKKLHYENNDISFVSADRVTIDSSTLCSEIKDKCKSKIYIQKEQKLTRQLFETISSKYTNFDTSTNQNNLPIPQTKNHQKSYDYDSSSSSYEDVNTTPPLLSKQAPKKTIKPEITESYKEESPKITSVRSANFAQPNKQRIGLKSASSSPFPKPIGMMNLGNTCFFNAAVQCLIRCKPLTDFILSSQCQSQINTKNPLGTKGRIVNAYRELLKEMATSSSSLDTDNNYSRYTSSYFYPSRYSRRSSINRVFIVQ